MCYERKGLTIGVDGAENEKVRGKVIYYFNTDWFKYLNTTFSSRASQKKSSTMASSETQGIDATIAVEQAYGILDAASNTEFVKQMEDAKLLRILIECSPTLRGKLSICNDVRDNFLQSGSVNTISEVADYYENTLLLPSMLLSLRLTNPNSDCTLSQSYSPSF